jgi:hypothetical protein
MNERPLSTERAQSGTLRRSVADLEALGLDWGTAVIATAQRYGVRLMDTIVASGRVDDGRSVRS